MFCLAKRGLSMVASRDTVRAVVTMAAALETALLLQQVLLLPRLQKSLSRQGSVL